MPKKKAKPSTMKLAYEMTVKETREFWQSRCEKEIRNDKALSPSVTPDFKDKM